MNANHRVSVITAEDTWPIRHRVMWPNMPMSYVKLEDDAVGRHFGVVKRGRLLAAVSLFIRESPVGKEAQFRKLCTEVQEQGRGYATALLQYALAFCQEEGIQRLYCNARLNKAGFYQRFGLVKTDQLFTKGGIDYVIMERFF